MVVIRDDGGECEEERERGERGRREGIIVVDVVYASVGVGVDDDGNVFAAVGDGDERIGDEEEAWGVAACDTEAKKR